MSKFIRATLTLNIKYDISETGLTSEEAQDLISKRLRMAVNDIGGNGMLSGETELLVDAWSNSLEMTSATSE